MTFYDDRFLLFVMWCIFVVSISLYMMMIYMVFHFLSTSLFFPLFGVILFRMICVVGILSSLYTA